MAVIRNIEQLLELHEGRRNTVYRCTAGKLTIGIGHNLEANPISDAAIDVILDDDITAVERDLERTYPWYARLDHVRKMAMVDLCFNLGITKLKMFLTTMREMSLGNFEAAANALTDSLWFKQVGTRGPRIVRMIRTGEYPEA